MLLFGPEIDPGAPGVPRQAPLLQRSLVVQAFPSSQVVPFASAEHAFQWPVDVLQVLCWQIGQSGGSVWQMMAAAGQEKRRKSPPNSAAQGKGGLCRERIEM